MTQHIKSLLKNIVAKKDQNWKYDLLRSWPDIIGNIKTHVTIEKIAESSITLGVYDACWLQELYLLSPLILSLINKNLDPPRIKKVYFKQIIKKKQKKQCSLNVQPKEDKRKFHLPLAERQALEKINDPVLRKSLYDFRINCYRKP